MKYALTLLILLAGTPFLASASDIHYGSIETVTHDTILLHYRGPEGASYHTCSLDGDCKDHGAQSPDILPSLLGRTAYPLSSRGTYGLHTLASGPVTLYTLYTLTGDAPERVAFLPFTQFALRTVFSRDEETLVLVTTSGDALRYNIASGTYTATPVGTDLPFFSLSPRGTYLSAYSYAHERHRIWNLTTGEQVTIPSETPAFVEMSQDERYLAYTSGDDLVVATHNTPIRTIQGKAGIITDYIFLENTLYYVANQEDPFVWNLVAHDPETGTERIIDTNVSYADALRVVHGKLAYSIVQGKHRNIILYNPGDTTATTLSPYSDEPLSEDVLRKAQKLGGQHTVVLSPTKRCQTPRSSCGFTADRNDRQVLGTIHI